MRRTALWLLVLAGMGSWRGDAAEGRWVLTGAPSVIRGGHSATLLPTGKVLIVGGGVTDEPDLKASAELFDPATGAWSPAAAPTTPRTVHTATLLPSGRVLVVGGYNGVLGGSLVQAELYDPFTETWSGTAPLAFPRWSHTATLLSSGKVLVTGGFTGTTGADSQPVAAAELYDPAAGTWSAVGRLATARGDHTATLLRSGQVLVTGGSNSASGLAVGVATSELFDPRTGRWSSTGSLAQARYLHTATQLPSGRVLVAGGELRGSTAERTAVVELYDPATGKWTSANPLAAKRSFHTATLLPSGKVLVAGGSGGGATLDPNCELYDPATGIWTRDADVFLPAGTLGYATATLLPTGAVLLAGGDESNPNAQIYESSIRGLSAPLRPLGAARDRHTLTVLPSGQVLAAGGFSGGQALAGAELFDPVTGAWKATGSLAQARQNHTATLLPSGKVLVAGGDFGPASGGLSTLNSAELYDPAKGRWEKTGSMVRARREHVAVLLPSGKVLVTGGRTGVSAEATAELYDPETGTWTATGSMAWRRVQHTATVLLSGKVLVAGGNGGNAELYDPATGRWTSTGSLLLPRAQHTATLLPSGRVLVAGGYGYAHLSEVEVYEPALGTWFQLGVLASPRAEHEAVLLPSGKVLVAGGTDGISLLANAEIFDPALGWSVAGPLSMSRLRPGAALLPSGQVLLAGGSALGKEIPNAELLSPAGSLPDRAPVITSVPAAVRFGTPLEITGQRFRGDSESSSGGTRSSAANFPLVQLVSLEGQQRVWLPIDPRQSFWDEPMTLTVSRLPATLSPGWHLLSVVTAGRVSAAKVVSVACGVAIVRQPDDRTVAVGGAATFTVDAQGARTFQWQKDGVDIPGANGPAYTTPPIQGADSGTRYQVRLGNGCASATSRAAVLTVQDQKAPSVKVLSPSGGEYWLLSEAGDAPSSHLITWAMADDVRVCRVQVALVYSRDGGASWQEAPAGGGLPAGFGPGGTCAAPGPTETALSYSVPMRPPAGAPGALYKIQVRVTDQAGLVTTATSPNPFYIVQPNPDAVRTLILAHPARMQAKMGLLPAQTAALMGKLRELASHPRVQGLVVDLGGITDLSGLYAAWDADTASPDKANRVLFGCHPPLAAGCASEKRGLRDALRELLAVYGGVKFVVLVGDDRILPFARIADGTALLPESRYPAGGALTATGTTVGQALARNRYLSDDPLVSLGPLTLRDLEGSDEDERAFLPDLAVGRLVETPEEITTTIAVFISRDGILDLSQLDPDRGHKVLVTGYDFLLDSGRIVREQWKNALGLALPHDDDSLAPVDGKLLTPSWSAATVAARGQTLKSHLQGDAGPPYAVSVLNGHATHYQEGVPGANPFDIQGLEAADLYGGDRCGAPVRKALDLAGGIVLAAGCHGGLPVAGSCARDADHSLDLPQTFLARGAVAYVANTGYGWGLLYGVGYAERLMEILNEELTRSRVVGVGEAVQKAKLRYFLEAPRLDPYDEKTLMQWTLFGLPMYAVRTGLAGRAVQAGVAAPPVAAVESASALPSFLTQLNLRFDFTAPGVYTKRNALGTALKPSPGCPAPARGEPAGCYYTLNGLVERGTGVGDLPIQPYFVYDSRLSGTSQHGVLWKGGVYDQETGWMPIVGELVSNGGSSANHGSAPRHLMMKPKPRRRVLGEDPEGCRPSDLEVSSLVVPTGEALKREASDPVYSLQRLFREIDLEVFFFNNTLDGDGNCDRTGPELLPGLYGGAYHRVRDSSLEWAVPAEDESGVWRVVVVYNDQSALAAGRGAWVPVELREENGVWTGALDVRGRTRVTYVVQAVDLRGNVTWLDYVGDAAPASGVDVGLPATVDVDLR